MIEEFEEIKSLIDYQYTTDVVNSGNDADFVNIVAKRVAELMDTNIELFFNHLYRMDIDERSIHNILNSPDEDNVYTAIALIIIERQKKRLETKRKYKQDKIEGWDDF